MKAGFWRPDGLVQTAAAQSIIAGNNKTGLLLPPCLPFFLLPWPLNCSLPGATPP